MNDWVLGREGLFKLWVLDDKCVESDVLFEQLKSQQQNNISTQNMSGGRGSLLVHLHIDMQESSDDIEVRFVFSCAVLSTQAQLQLHDGRRRQY
jgi:hypothetical protein